jgi:hypothetical protein
MALGASKSFLIYCRFKNIQLFLNFYLRLVSVVGFKNILYSIASNCPTHQLYTAKIRTHRGIISLCGCMARCRCQLPEHIQYRLLL